MITILIGLLLALLVIRELADWGLATFGLLGWWLVLPFIGALAVGSLVALIEGRRSR